MRLYQLAAVIMLSVLTTVLVLTCLARTDGLLVYSLDDPYIHLSLAETILQGGYGVNQGEYASPSSSIIYPFLLAGAIAIGPNNWMPLVLNILPMMAVAWIFAGIYWRHAVNPAAQSSVMVAIFVLPFLLYALNMVALPLTGMEHPLHILASLWIMVGVIALANGQGISWMLISGIVLAPLIRFEGLALSLAALVALVVYRHIRLALVTGVVLGLCLTAYVVFMTRLGLPILPSSVMSKSAIAETAVDGGFSGILTTFKDTLWVGVARRAGAVVLIAFALIVLAISEPSRTRADTVIGMVGGFAVFAHLLAGDYGWFGRYEIYVVGIAMVSLLYLYGPWLREKTNRLWLRIVGTSALILAVAVPYLRVQNDTARASENIFAQQYQMHRFSTEFFPYPVAINDLGYVSYQNEIYVLDLWGLGSEEARQKNRRGEFRTEEIVGQTENKTIAYAMIYTEVFDEAIPAEWCRIATLTTPAVTAAYADVDFYLIERERESEIRLALEAFRQTIPDVASLGIQSCQDGA
ncbi:hypothetical protein AAD018_000220 [Aestuariibius insulae]|uniref:hypothetical protein n=1 Tax=Aestuariibius insulae TaxID=2058287 RepID=UPI00348B2E39